MRNDPLILRLAAANPVPVRVPAPVARPVRRRRRQPLIALAAAVVVAIPAAAFAGDIGSFLGISNGGTTVSTSDVLLGQGVLDEAMQELKVGGTMQYLGSLNGVAFYVARNADGNLCLAIDHVNEQYAKGFGCGLNAATFPSADAKVLMFPPALELQGVAADGVATVEALDADGNVLDSTPVVRNLFASDKQLGEGAAVYIETLDASGNVLAKQQLPGR